MKKIIFFLFLLLHLVLLNINSAEWGDSYRILRASEYIRNIDYPADEKRPPFYSAVLAVRPEGVDQIFWAKIIMFLVSTASFIAFSKLVQIYIKEEKYQNLALVLFALNPVFLYWSLRIYADVFFTLLVLLAFYLYKTKENFKWAILIGGIAGISVLTRFEGYLLGLSLGVAYLLRKDWKRIVLYGAGGLIFVVPFLIWRNPLTSSYFEEPAGRAYDFRMFLTYIISLVYIFGFTGAALFFFKYTRDMRQGIGGNLGIVIFVILELLLILAWPAAVPRLFVPIIPFLIVYLVLKIRSFFESSKKTNLTPLLGLTTLLVIYAVAQYFLKLQFLILIKPVFILIILINLTSLLFIYRRNFKLFAVSIFMSMMFWSLSTIWLHKDNMRAVKDAAEYAADNLTGNIGYNDISSVSDWYLNQRTKEPDVNGIYYNYGKKQDLDHGKLEEKNLDYLILTNEHNTDTTLDWKSRPYLELVKDFTYISGGKTFFAYIFKINPL